MESIHALVLLNASGFISFPKLVINLIKYEQSCKILYVAYGPHYQKTYWENFK